MGGDVEGALARQNGISTASYQSFGDDGDGDGDGLGAGAGGSGPFDHVCHLWSTLISLTCEVA